MTPTSQWTRLFAANSTAASIVAPATTVIQPAGDGVINVSLMSYPFDEFIFAFFGAGADNNTAIARITGWSRMILAGSNPLWIPTPLSLLALTFSGMTGVAGAAALDTDRFADTIAETTAYTVAKEITGAGVPGGTAAPENTLMTFSVDPKAAELVQVQVAVGNATNVNAMFRGLRKR